jgi:hypothetical protein
MDSLVGISFKPRQTKPMSNPSSHADAPEPVLLIIADISGYTRYMTANAKTLAHSQTIITELVMAIIHTVELPLEVAKLEGDAVFLFCRKESGAKPWPEAKREIGDKLLIFFRMFGEKVRELSQSTTCNCNACAHIDQLRLKVVVHSGEALFHRVLNFQELAGLDVIIVHRLLKNSVKADQYLLLTEVARQDLEFAKEIHWGSGSENYGDIGSVQTLIYLPDGLPVVQGKSSVGQRFSRSWALFLKLWFAPFARQRTHNPLSSDATPIGKAGLAVLTFLLTPLFLPAGLIVAFLHSLRPAPPRFKPGDGHEHKADGSCSGKH